MRYKALVSFCGKITKTKGQEFDLEDKKAAKDLLEGKLIEKVTKNTEKVTINTEKEPAEDKKNED